MKAYTLEFKQCIPDLDMVWNFTPSWLNLANINPPKMNLKILNITDENSKYACLFQCRKKAIENIFKQSETLVV